MPPSQRTHAVSMGDCSHAWAVHTAASACCAVMVRVPHAAGNRTERRTTARRRRGCVSRDISSRERASDISSRERVSDISSRERAAKG